MLNLHLDATTAIAEWEARFDDAVPGQRTRIREVGDPGIRRIAGLREYWASERYA